MNEVSGPLFRESDAWIVFSVRSQFSVLSFLRSSLFFLFLGFHSTGYSTRIISLRSNKDGEDASPTEE
jgi:hypothetical protein